jgi:protein pelota
LQKRGNKSILAAKSKFLLLHSPSHHVHSLAQILSSPETSNQLKDTKFAQEGIMLEKFFKMLESDPLRAWYGEGHVLKAAERGAIGKLLISDEIFRSPSVARRKQFVKLVEDVKAYGGEVLIFSSMHESGQREWRFSSDWRGAVVTARERKSADTAELVLGAELNTMTGLAAILTYPLDIEDVEREEEEEREEAARKAAEAEAEQ